MTPQQKAEYLTNDHAVNVLIITDMRGRVLWLKGPYLGTELAQLAECKPALRAHLRRLDLPIASDAGFVMNDSGVPENEWCTHYQTVGPSMIRLAKFVVDNHQYFDSDKVDFFQRIYDSTRYISQGRSVVQHTIDHLKTFAVFRETWRGRIEGHDELGLYSTRLSHVVQFIGAVVSRCIDNCPKQFQVLPTGWRQALLWLSKQCACAEIDHFGCEKIHSGCERREFVALGDRCFASCAADGCRAEARDGGWRRACSEKSTS